MTGIESAGLSWRKSSYSNTTANCVEVAPIERRVALRDSKNATGPTLSWPARGWAAFLTTLR